MTDVHHKDKRQQQQKDKQQQLATTRLAVGHHCNYSIRDRQWSWFTSFWRGIT
jgi:hypothetical protein